MKVITLFNTSYDGQIHNFIFFSTFYRFRCEYISIMRTIIPVLDPKTQGILVALILKNFFRNFFGYVLYYNKGPY